MFDMLQYQKCTELQMTLEANNSQSLNLLDSQVNYILTTEIRGAFKKFFGYTFGL